MARDAGADTLAASYGYGQDMSSQGVSEARPVILPLSPQQPGEPTYLDLLDLFPGQFLDAEEFDFDFGPSIAATPSQYPYELDAHLQQPTNPAGDMYSVWGADDDIASSSGCGVSSQPVFSIDPSELTVARDEPEEVVLDAARAASDISHPGAVLASTELGNANGGGSGTSQSGRRRSRSPSPSPQTHRQRLNAAALCFQVDIAGRPGQESRRPCKRIRGPHSEQRKQEIAAVRKKKACLRCHMQKAKCNGETPCSNCLRVRGKERLCRVICERFNISDAIAFRIGNSKFNQETATVRAYPNWILSATDRIMVLQRPPAASSHWPKGDKVRRLEIRVKKFVPSGSDITTERWRSGQNEVILELPAFSAFNNQATTSALLGWINDNFKYYAKDMTEQPGHWLISTTFEEAIRFASKNPHSIVKLALKIWIGARMAQEFFCVVEDNEFGIDVVNDQNSIHHGQCPVPPVLDHQLDVLMIQEMISMKAKIFDTIEPIVRGRNSRSRWYEIYLTVFVLLANLQYVYKSQQRWWKMHFNTGQGNAIGQAYRSLSYRFMKRYAFSAQNLLSHFRYGLKGPVPFTLDWDKETTKKLGDLDKDAVKYVKYVSAHVRRNRDEFVDIARRASKEEYEGDIFWLSQLFVDLDMQDGNDEDFA